MEKPEEMDYESIICELKGLLEFVNFCYVDQEDITKQCNKTSFDESMIFLLNRCEDLSKELNKRFEQQECDEITKEQEG